MSPYEVAGLPLYLLKDISSFSINVGLYGISETTLNEASKSNLSVKIFANKSVVGSKKIDNVNFAPEIMHYVKVDSCSNSYTVDILGSIPKEINEKWDRNVNGIGENGAIFEYSQYGGKKIKTIDGLTANTDYYCLLTTVFINCDKFSSITFTKIADIEFKNSRKYPLYIINIKEIDIDSRNFCKKFGMTLSHSNPKLIPLWPPCKVNNQEFIYFAPERRFFILKSSDKEKRSLYSSYPIKKLDSQPLSENKMLIKVPSKLKDFIYVGKPSSPFSYILLSTAIKPKVKDFALSYKENSNDKLQIDISAKVKIIRYKGNLPVSLTIAKENLINIENARKNEYIEVLYGLDPVLILRNEKKITNNDQHTDEFLYKALNCRLNLIDVPASLKWIMIEMKNYNKAYVELQKILMRGKISQNAINILINQCLKSRGEK